MESHMNWNHEFLEHSIYIVPILSYVSSDFCWSYNRKKGINNKIPNKQPPPEPGCITGDAPHAVFLVLGAHGAPTLPLLPARIRSIFSQWLPCLKQQFCPWKIGLSKKETHLPTPVFHVSFRGGNTSTPETYLFLCILLSLSAAFQFLDHNSASSQCLRFCFLGSSPELLISQTNI